MKKNIFIAVCCIIIVGILFFFLGKKENFNIYTLNIDTEDIIIKNQIKTFKNQSLEKKIEFLTKKLSEENFEGKNIKFTGIKEEKGEKIAYFDLTDTNEKDSWFPYFQGSFGAFTTKLSIIETLLQRDFEGKWIDGIKLTYNGKFQEFDHISFDDLIYWRKN